MARAFLARVLMCVLVLLFFVSPAQATNWLAYQKDWTHNGVIISDNILGNLEPQWNRVSSLQYYEPPVYQNGTIYFLEYSGATGVWLWLVTAIDKTTGQQLWQTSGTGYLKSNFAVGDGLIMIPADQLIALDATNGQQLWQASGSNYAFGNPLISNGLVFAQKKFNSGSYAGTFAFNARDGSVIWQNNNSQYFAHEIGIYKNSLILTTGTYSTNYSHIVSINITTGILNWTYDRSYNPLGPVVIDEPRGLGFLMGTTGVLTRINLNTGQELGATSFGFLPTMPLLFDGKACYVTSTLSYAGTYSYWECYDYINNIRLPRVTITKDFRLSSNFYTNPILVGDRVYMAMNTGQLASFGLDGNDFQRTDIADNPLSSMIYADGTFLIRNTALNTIYAVSTEPLHIAATSSVSLNSPYKTDGEYQEYLGQTHSHYVPDVLPKSTTAPGKTVKKYKDAGYDFIALTEHNIVEPNPGILGITFLENAEEDTQGHGGNHILALGIKEKVIQNPNGQLRTITEDKPRIQQVIDQGGLASLAHPNSYWYEWPISELKLLKNYQAIEIYNNGIQKSGRYLEFPTIDNPNPYDNAYALDKFDALLSIRKPVYATAGDDYTPADPGFDGAAVVVFAKSNNPDEILSNLKDGNFYALQGSHAPRIKVTTNGASITATSNTQSNIKFIGNGGKMLKEERNVLVSTYTANGSEIYVRVEVTADGKTSWSQPIYVNENKNVMAYMPGRNSIDLAKGS